MASKVEGEQLQGLVCPMCLDVFTNATLLSCGHTFCKGCLETYDEQHYDLDLLVCPMCRKTTKLGQNRIAGLTPNFLALGIQDELHKFNPSPSFCPLHSKVHNDIFCEVCKKLICLTCYLHSHKDHKIKKKEELEEELKRMADTLIQMSNSRKTQIEKSLNNAEQQRIDIHCHFSTLEKEIKDGFAEKVTILQKNEETLLKKLDSIRKDTENQLEGCIAKYRQVVDHINGATEVLRGYTGMTGKNLDQDTIKAHHLQCNDLEKLLKKKTDEMSMVRLKQIAESTRFWPSDEKLLDLGHIELGMKEKSNTQHGKTAAGANKKAKKVQRSSNSAVLPSLVDSKSLNIVKKVDAPGDIWGMSALSQDAVVVGYGGFRHGADRFSVTSEKKQHLKSNVGNVWDIAVLTDGRSVLHDAHTLCVYSSQGKNRKKMQYSCKGGYLSLCSDQHDNIYAVNINPEIYIFRSSSPNPHRVVPTGDIKPRQICVTKTGVMITSTCYTTPSTVTVFDRKGHAGSSITATDGNEYLYAAVDSQDRVLVARLRGRCDVLKLTRYTLEGTKLIQEMTFNPLSLHHVHNCVSFFTWSYMISLTPVLLTFANNNSLYFIELAV